MAKFFNTRRLLVFLLVLILCAGLFPLSALAEEQVQTRQIELNEAYDSITKITVTISGVTIADIAERIVTTTEESVGTWPTYTYNIQLDETVGFKEIITLKAAYTGSQSKSFPRASTSRDPGTTGASKKTSDLDNGIGEKWTINGPETKATFYIYTAQSDIRPEGAQVTKPSAQYTFIFHAPHLPVTNFLADAEVISDYGQFLFKPYLLDPDAYEVPARSGNYTEKGVGDVRGVGKIAVPYGTETVDVKLTLENADVTDAYIGESKQTVKDGCFELTLPASKFGTKTTVTLKDTSGVAPDNKYELIVYSAGHEGMPDKVVDYLSIASQYTNGGNSINRYVGINAVATLLGMADEERYGRPASTNFYLNTSPYSLGSFGGYITYYYKDAIKDDPNNPYGVDFIVFGNSVDGSDAFSEPANVLVSEDGIKFYSLAGSVHYDDKTNWNYSRTYVNNDGSVGEGSGITFGYPLPERYPLFQWTEENKRQMTFTGVTFTDGIPAFGYADVGYQAFMDPDEGAIFDNRAYNPYIAPVSKNGRLYFEHTDGMDLAWAVDENGMPVTFENGIHYIKLQNSSGAIKGSLGETSAEIHIVMVSKPADDAVGASAVPASITVNREAVDLENGVYVYEDVPVPASGAFVVSVEAAQDANVYINSFPEKNHTFGSVPEHGIIRVIVQDGDKEPQIYYLNLKPDENLEGEKSSTITFVAGGVGSAGTVNGQESVEITYTDSSAEKTFPTPIYEGRSFKGWFDDKGKEYKKWTSELPTKLTLTAKWEYNVPEGTSDKIKVTFRLIGAIQTGVNEVTGKTYDVDLSKGMDGYYGSEYRTWIATRTYTMKLGDTNYNLLIKALANAGIEQKGADNNYIESITAPEAHGGYELGQFTNGQYSGWMYTVNGKHPGYGLKEFDLKNGDTVVWHYVNDYRYEVEDWFDDEAFPSLAEDDTFYNKWLEAEDIAPTADNAPNTGNSRQGAATTLAPKVTARDGAAEASISAPDMNKAVEDAKKNESGAIIIQPEISGKASKTTVELPKASVSSMASDTDADLKIVTPSGIVTIPNDALASIASQAGGSTISVVVEEVEKAALTAEQQKAVGDNPVFDVSILSGDKQISSFGGKSLTISLPYTLKDGENSGGVTVWYLSDTGKLEWMTCKYDKVRGFAAFTTNHLSAYVVGYDAWTNPFTDVKIGDWFFDAVRFAVQNELFTGISEESFAPNTNMTRAMLVTVLYRMEGKPAVTGTNFTDVKAGEWYTDAIIWANTNGIVTGYESGLFGTNNPITREQMAAILYCYTSYKKYDVTKTNDLAAYTDANTVTSYALSAMKWANAENLITGRTATTLAPSGTATRAEVATILMRFAESVTK